MWWDFDCWYSAPSSALLTVMRSTLDIDNVACQESALHGPGHWYDRQHPEEVERIIDEFLGRGQNLRSELRQYAQAARAGLVMGPSGSSSTADRSEQSRA